MQTAKICDKQFTQPVVVPPLRGKEDFTATVALVDLGQAYTICATLKPSLEIIEKRIKGYLTLGKSLSVDTAIYLSDARETFFKRTIDWMVWAQEITEYDSRFLYVLLSVGDMMRELGEVYYLKHKSTDIVRLEIAATIDDKKKKCAFLNDADFLTLSRDELRAKAAQLKGIKAREEHAEKVAKKGIQLDFFGMLDGLSNCTLTNEKEAMSFAQKIEPIALLKASQNVLSVLEEATKLNRFAGLTQEARRAFASAMREAAAMMDC